MSRRQPRSLLYVRYGRLGTYCPLPPLKIVIDGFGAISAVQGTAALLECCIVIHFVLFIVCALPAIELLTAVSYGVRFEEERVKQT